jgi:hypothetical protein
MTIVKLGKKAYKVKGTVSPDQICLKNQLIGLSFGLDAGIKKGPLNSSATQC